MITYISGTARDMRIASTYSSITVIVQGIGYALLIPARLLVKIGQNIELEVYSHYTQEHGTQLFGFQTSDERILFGLILGCSGVGPKLALSLLNALPPVSLKAALMSNDIKLLSSVEGIGAKKAETISLYLKDKIVKLNFSQEADEPLLAKHKQLQDAFTSLGYSRIEITAIFDYLKDQTDMYEASFQDLLRQGLSFITQRSRTA